MSLRSYNSGASSTGSGPGGRCIEHRVEWPQESGDWFIGQAKNNDSFQFKICAVERIGQGGFAEVFKGHRFCKLPKGESCLSETLAVKVLTYEIKTSNSATKSSRSTNVSSRIKEEVDVTWKLYSEVRNASIVAPILVQKWPRQNPTKAFLCLEYCDQGDANRYLNNIGGLNETLARQFIRHVVSGLKALKSISYFHRDIKASNIFVSSKNGAITFKLGDFGLVAKISAQNREICGTPSAMAPEMNGRDVYNEQVDMWSLGILLFTKVHKSDQGPFLYDREAKTEKRIEAQHRPLYFHAPIGELFEDLIRKLLRVDPNQRLSLDSIDFHKFFKVEESQFASDSGFATSSLLSSNVTASTNAKVYPKAKLSLINESSEVYRNYPRPNTTPFTRNYTNGPMKVDPQSLYYQNSIISPQANKQHYIQASPMSSTCHSRTVASLLPPLRTLR